MKGLKTYKVCAVMTKELNEESIIIKISGKSNALLSNTWVKEEMIREIRKCLNDCE